MSVAAKTTHIPASSTDSIVSSQSIYVYGIVVAAGSNGVVTVEKADGTTLIMELRTVANTSAVMDIPFLADGGLAITTPAGITCTVFHSQNGA